MLKHLQLPTVPIIISLVKMFSVLFNLLVLVHFKQRKGPIICCKYANVSLTSLITCVNVIIILICHCVCASIDQKQFHAAVLLELCNKKSKHTIRDIAPRALARNIRQVGKMIEMHAACSRPRITPL